MLRQHALGHLTPFLQTSPMLFLFLWTDIDYSEARVSTHVSLSKKPNHRALMKNVDFTEDFCGEDRGQGKTAYDTANNLMQIPIKSFSSPFLSLPHFLWPMKELPFVLVGTSHSRQRQSRCPSLS